jgi:hypothetical protein
MGITLVSSVEKQWTTRLRAVDKLWISCEQVAAGQWISV